MRELTATETAEVTGGTVIGEFASDWGALGTLAGYLLTGTLRGAAIGGAYGAVLGAAFGLGWYIGERVHLF